MCVPVSAQVCGGQRSTSDVIFRVLSTLFFETGPLIDLELTRQAWLARSKTQRSAGFHYFQGARATTFSFLLCILRIKLRLSCLCSKHFTDSGPSPAFAHAFVGLLDALEKQMPASTPSRVKGFAFRLMLLRTGEWVIRVLISSLMSCSL